MREGMASVTLDAGAGRRPPAEGLRDRTRLPDPPEEALRRSAPAQAYFCVAVAVSA